MSAALAHWKSGQSAPLEHLTHFEAQLAELVRNVFVLKGGMGRKQHKAISGLWPRFRKPSSA